MPRRHRRLPRNLESLRDYVRSRLQTSLIVAVIESALREHLGADTNMFRFLRLRHEYRLVLV